MSLFTRVPLVLGLPFVMTVKPGLEVALLDMGLVLVVGVLAGSLAPERSVLPSKPAL
jgi:hypothetical protein